MMTVETNMDGGLPSASLRIAVIIATKGRPHAVVRILQLLERQSLRPTNVFVSATELCDVEQQNNTALNVQFLFGPAGSSRQRNLALEMIRSSHDLVVFFDDDFAPASDWIAQCVAKFTAASDVVGICGGLIKDGAHGEAVSWEQAEALIKDPPVLPRQAIQVTSLYGCNMAFRLAAVQDACFDERLVLYGWLEDKDFSRTVGRRGRLVQDMAMHGVHLGLRTGRTSGRKYGYSQIANSWYLHRKGTLTSREVWSNTLKALTANCAKYLWPEPHIDRKGRLSGNIIAVLDLLRGSCRPEKTAEL